MGLVALVMTMVLLMAAPAFVLAQQAVGQSSDDSLTIAVKGVSFKMIRMQGSTSEQGSDCSRNEKPAHKVTLSTYYIGETEVTQELWKAVMGSNPSYFKGDKRPVDQVLGRLPDVHP